MQDIAEQAELLTPPGGVELRLRFSGPFEGRQVTWDATLVTLEAWRRQHPGEEAAQNFIAVGDDTPDGTPITVGLNVTCIDLPTVRKAMMMVRQYKRLQRGHHAYGPRVAPARAG
jgi:hypothetical protein